MATTTSTQLQTATTEATLPLIIDWVFIDNVYVKHGIDGSLVIAMLIPMMAMLMAVRKKVVVMMMMMMMMMMMIVVTMMIMVMMMMMMMMMMMILMMMMVMMLVLMAMITANGMYVLTVARSVLPGSHGNQWVRWLPGA